MPDSFINRGDTSIIYQMADVFKDIIYIPVELNSRNPEGNLSSDVINRSFITNIAKIINDDKSTVEEQNAMVEAYAKQSLLVINMIIVIYFLNIEIVMVI